MAKNIHSTSLSTWQLIGRSLSIIFLLFTPVFAQDSELDQLAQERPSAHVRSDRARQQDRTPVITYSQPVKPSFPDLPVRDQNNRKLRFYTDLIKGKVVVLTFFYSSCEYLCDIQGTVLRKLQSRLGKRLGTEVFFVSVTRDPSTDTSPRLKAWGRKFKATSGWTLVTGEVSEIGKLLKMFLGDEPGRAEMHSAAVLIGNDQTQNWVVVPGVADPEPLLLVINSVAKNDSRKVQKIRS